MTALPDKLVLEVKADYAVYGESDTAVEGVEFRSREKLTFALLTRDSVLDGRRLASPINLTSKDVLELTSGEGWQIVIGVGPGIIAVKRDLVERLVATLQDEYDVLGPDPDIPGYRKLRIRDLLAAAKAAGFGGKA